MDALVRPGSCGELSESSVFNILNDMSFPALPLSHVIVHCRSITGAAPGAAPHMQVLLGKHRGSTGVTRTGVSRGSTYRGSSGQHIHNIIHVQGQLGESQKHHMSIVGAVRVAQGHHRSIMVASCGGHRGWAQGRSISGHHKGIIGASFAAGASRGITDHPRGIPGASPEAGGHALKWGHVQHRGR